MYVLMYGCQRTQRFITQAYTVIPQVIQDLKTIDIPDDDDGGVNADMALLTSKK